MATTPPRLFGIKADDVDTVAIIRRGPSDWCHVSRWDVPAATVESGSWLHGTIAPQKCDLSPDGRWLLYSAVNYPGDWEGGAVYEAISRLPWLRALAAWEAGTTYTRGAHFVDDRHRNDLGEPDTGTLQLGRVGIALTPPDQFAVERRHGWSETADTPPRSAGGPWDEHRTVAMQKQQPGGTVRLHVTGAYAAFRSIPTVHAGAHYELLHADGTATPLSGVQWAEWTATGQLLTADESGVLHCYDLNKHELHETQRHDLSQQQPDPQPPPPEAASW